MSLLNRAIKDILFQHPIFCVMKEDYKIKEGNFIAIHKFIKNNEMVMVQNPIHAHTLTQDKNIRKIYYSNEIIPNADYLPFIQLGIEYLLEHAEIENAQKGKIILDKHINNLRKQEAQNAHQD